MAFPLSVHTETVYKKGKVLFNKQNRNRIIDMENVLMAARWEVGKIGEKGEGINKYKLVVTEQSWGCRVEHRE